jgi:hypothetical protein
VFLFLLLFTVAISIDRLLYGVDSRMVNDYEYGGMRIDLGKLKYSTRRKLIPVPFCLSQISYDLPKLLPLEKPVRFYAFRMINRISSDYFPEQY